VIGLEIASSARERGCEVAVLEAAPGAMGRCVAPEGACFVEGLHRDAGVAMHFGVAIEAVDRAASGAMQVMCRDGTSFDADCVVAGVGMERNVTLARDAGLVVDGGILVDERGRTTAPQVFAAGDVAAFRHPLYGRHLRLESWRHAQNHGIAVGRVMAGGDTPYDDVPWFWTDQHGVNLQIAGFPAEGERSVLRQGADERTFATFHLAPDGSVVGVTGANSPREVRGGEALIRSRAPMDPALLADPAVPMQKIVAAARQAR
jgi:NADPH-dependent 2,4-dienoyl-CoA reductase/sulfur reductase-like enzyme